MAREVGILVSYDGTTYWIPDEEGRALIAEGVVVPDEDLPGEYRLDIHHILDEIQAVATPIERGPSDDERGRGRVEAGLRRMIAVRYQHHGHTGAR